PVTRRLFTTADDFGDTPAVNEAVVDAYRHGVLRFASLMVLRPAAAAAAAAAKEKPGLGVRLHLELCSTSPELAGLRYFADLRARAGLEGEIRAQLDALLALGVQPTHIDGHMNVHVHPVVFPAVCRIAREYGVGRVRLPRGEWEDLKSFPGGLNVESALLAGVFEGMGAWVEAAARGLAVPRACGALRSGLMSEEYVVWLLSRMSEGDTELYFHPTTDPALRAGPRPTRSHQSVTELETLRSPRVRRALDEYGVELVSAR
ncbi:MAG: ChbG/HpnK family deacetylase, partial [Elusimicrobia bacterium]|nr:ChbG/HpnK family deacetylase [Elusimicrobiota bacterium]